MYHTSFVANVYYIFNVFVCYNLFCYIKQTILKEGYVVYITIQLAFQSHC